jgi:hypothetical protein
MTGGAARRLSWTLVALLVAAGCTGPHREPPPPSIEWKQLTLPVPSGDPGRPSPRAAVRCADAWYIVGAVAGEGGSTRPAAWRSADAATWTPLAFEPLTYYGRQNILYSVGCRDGRIAVVGARTGGVHGNPRVATWYQLPDGTLREVIASFLLYGGNDAVNAARLAGGPTGWLIAGNRVSGGAVWTSADATEFQLVEFNSVPRSTANDVVAAGPGWVVVGGELSAAHIGNDPAAWTSVDGRQWSRSSVPASGEDAIMQRVTPVPDGLFAVGVSDGAFGGWRERGGVWQAAGRFGDARGQIAAGVSGLAVLGDRVLATTEAGGGRQLWVSDVAGQRWAAAPLPVMVAPGADTSLSVVGGGSGLLLLGDDGRTGSAWLATRIDGSSRSGG